MKITEHLVADTESEALEDLHRLGCTDGLPVVIPTPERVGALVAASGLDGDLVLATVGPAGGLATVEKVAANAVMAGCSSDHLPVVLAALQAVCDERFDLTEVQSTTHCLAPLLIVNGPARQACGEIASGFGALGPGHRANASIGRALRLCMINIGGGRPGISDMALLGHPGKFTYVLGEAEEESSFPPLHTSLGFTAEQSAVTVVGVEAPQSVISVPSADPVESAQRLLASLATVVASPAHNNATFANGTQVVILNPDHARVFADAGMDRATIQDALVERSANRRGDLRRLNPSFVPPGDDDDLLRALRFRESAIVMVAGGGGVYSMVVPSWGAGPHGNLAITKEIDLFPSCEIPFMSEPAG
ncbi:MAG: hypothetical protein ACRDV9_05205 [Acidimicrobiia bacterium]